MNMAKNSNVRTIHSEMNQKLRYKHMKPFYLVGMLLFSLYTQLFRH